MPEASLSAAKKITQPTFKPIYLDNHATTPIDPRVLEEMLPYLQDNFGNAASNHFYGIKAKYAVDQAREEVAKAIHAKPEEIVFTSGATEANNMVIKGLFDTHRDKKPHFIVSTIEHKCILNAIKHVEKLGAKVTYISAGKNGIVNLDELESAITTETVLVSVMFANNEIGSINPIQQIAEICRKNNIALHTDAAQAAGKLEIDVKKLGIDFMSVSAHKFYGPKGVGFLYVRKERQQALEPLLDGGGQEFGLRSGTINVPGVVGLEKALKLAVANLKNEATIAKELRNELMDVLNRSIPNIILNGPPLDSDERLPNNLNITIKGLDTDRLRALVPLIAFSSSSACNSASPTPSYVLKAIGRSNEEAYSSIRFGLGRFNQKDEVREAAKQLATAISSIA